MSHLHERALASTLRLDERVSSRVRARLSACASRVGVSASTSQMDFNTWMNTPMPVTPAHAACARVHHVQTGVGLHAAAPGPQHTQVSRNELARIPHLSSGERAAFSAVRGAGCGRTMPCTDAYHAKYCGEEFRVAVEGLELLFRRFSGRGGGVWVHMLCARVGMSAQVHDKQ
jgi:hypothetical protein